MNKIKKVILVFKTHFDIGFTDLAKDVIAQYADGMLRQVLETCRATKHMGKLKYVWTMPAWPLFTALKDCAPNLKIELEEYIRNGQIIWHALPFTSHTDFCGEEEYLEGLRYAKELSRMYHKPYPIAAKMTDVPGHGLMLPEILAASGISFLHLGCNAFAMPPAVPDLFFWQAPSGRKILTMYGKGGYGSSLQAPKGWNLPVWMALNHTHDNCGPHSAGFIQKLAAEAKELYPEAEIVCGTMDDFYRELALCDLSHVPVITEDLADTWIHGIGAYPKEVSLIRDLRRRYRQLTIRLWEQDPSLLTKSQVKALIVQYYENMHLFGEHTWGADVKTFLGADRVYQKKDFLEAKKEARYRFMEESWQEQRERARLCEKAVKELEDYLEQGLGVHVADSTTKIGNPLPQVSASILQAEDKDGLNRVENHRYCLVFDMTTGVIESLWDKKLQCVLLEKQGDISVFSYQYTRHGIQKMTDFLKHYGYRYHAWGIQDYGREAYPECEDETFHPQFHSVSIGTETICFYYRGGDSANCYGNAKEIRLSVTLPAESDEIFVELALDGKAETPWLESGSFCMPLANGNHEYFFNKNGCVLNPKKDIRACANHVYYALEEFVAVQNGTAGLCVLPQDTPLLSIGEDGMYLYREKHEECKAILYFNAFNNMWGTNFPQWQGGDYRYRFVLFGYETKEQDQLYARCVSRRLPKGIVLPDSMQLLAIRQTAEGTLLVTRSLRDDTEQAAVTAVGYEIVEVDYFDRILGEAKMDTYPFTLLAYGLHLFLLKGEGDCHDCAKTL